MEIQRVEKLNLTGLFLQELKLSKELNHSNVLRCLDSYTTARNYYIVFEYCDGGDLEKLIKKGYFADREDFPRAEAILKDIFSALLYLEGRHIVHRDLKISNILLHHGQAKIGDFGFATFS